MTTKVLTTATARELLESQGFIVKANPTLVADTIRIKVKELEQLLGGVGEDFQYKYDIQVRTEEDHSHIFSDEGSNAWNDSWC